MLSISFLVVPPIFQPPEIPPNATEDGLMVTIGYNDTCISGAFVGTVNFTCVVVGGRMLTNGIEWLLNGEVFTGDSRSRIISVNDSASLLAIGIDGGASVEQDLKNYTCRATNSDGSATITSQLSRCGKLVVLYST